MFFRSKLPRKKKNSSDVNIALLHWFIGGVLIYFSVVIFFGVPLLILTKAAEGKYLILAGISMKLVSFGGLWLGVKISARHLMKMYLSKNTERIVQLSTIYFVVAWLLFNGYAWYQSKLDLIGIIPDLVFFSIGVTIFFTASKKYLVFEDSEAKK